MILQALTRYYEALAEKSRVPRPGWRETKVSFAAELGADGALLDILPLREKSADGKKLLPRAMVLPSIGEAKGNGIKPNFTWENSAYLFGIDGKGKPQRALQCFEAARELHLSLLAACEGPFARAICAFYTNWDPQNAGSDPVLAPQLPELTGANLVFLFADRFPADDPELAQVWQKHYDAQGEGAEMRCLVTGRRAVPALVHPPISTIAGSQSPGMSLVSFNAHAYESFDRVDGQGLNAPVSRYAAFAYTTALNTLLADKRRVQRVGDTTVVCWAEDAEPQYQDLYGLALAGDTNTITDGDLMKTLRRLAGGDRVDWQALPLRPENRFYLLGLSPNAARLSVRFFLQGSFGDFAKNLLAHYERIDIVRPSSDKFAVLPLWALLRETVNKKAQSPSPAPQMAADTLRSVLTGGRYPTTLYGQTMLRIRAEQDVNRGKAAILKAYLLKNCDDETIKEAATVALNEQSNSIPYLLGRLFSLLENIQNSATGATTVKDSFFSSACMTPAAVFPHLLRLKENHRKVLAREKPGLSTRLEKQVGELMGRLPEQFPARLSPAEQGAFLLGYYHQTQKRYEKKDNREENENG